jgi:hypothetical protein
MRHCKSLISNCLTFTDGLITSSSTTESEAPALIKLCCLLIFDDKMSVIY